MKKTALLKQTWVSWFEVLWFLKVGTSTKAHMWFIYVWHTLLLTAGLSCRSGVTLCWLDQAVERGEDDYLKFTDTSWKSPKIPPNQILVLAGFPSPKSASAGAEAFEHKTKGLWSLEEYFARPLQSAPDLCLSLQAGFVSTTRTYLKCPSQCSAVELHYG